jgi:predicted  nucleic acid-binding Zn-ribbon protein
MNKTYTCNKCGNLITQSTVNYGCEVCYKKREQYYPEDILNSSELYDKYQSSNSFNEYFKALEYANEIDGVVYTETDDEGIDILYWKGNHFVNKLGYCVLKRIN